MAVLPQKTSSTETTEIKTAEGISIGEGFQEIASTIANYGVKALQTGLNSLPTQKTSLKEDDVLGPKTVSRTKEALVQNGFEEIQNTVKNNNIKETEEPTDYNSIEDQYINKYGYYAKSIA
ncbi:MAG: hypothetical protein R3Y43_08225 [Alphaproteobacteria bacterium]